MFKVFSLVVIAASIIFAQSNCDSLVKKTVDEMDGSFFISNPYPIIISDDNDKGFVISLLGHEDKSLIFAIKVVGAGRCIDEKNKINILFTDNTRLELISNNDFNCDANSVVYFGKIFGKKDELKQLSTKKIKAMRVWTRNSFVQENFPSEKSDYIYNVINCLIK